MKQYKEDWTDVVRRSLKESEYPIPKGGWERLEREIGMPHSKMSRLSGTWMKIAAVAAVVLIFAGVGELIIRNSRNVDIKGDVVTLTAAGSDQSKLDNPIHSVVSASTDKVVADIVKREYNNSIVSQRAPDIVVADVVAIDVDKILVDTAVQTTIEPDVVIIQDTMSVVSNNSADALVQKPTAKQAASIYNKEYKDLFADNVVAKRRDSGGKTSFGAFAGGAMSAKSQGSMANGGVVPATLLKYGYVGNLLAASAEQYSYKHSQPLRFGLTFRKEFKYGLSLESGLVYTLLMSDVSIAANVNKVEQTVHYLGIPLRVNWDFLRRGGFSMYVGAGAMAEKCVGATLGTEPITIKPVQWSVTGLVGAQYRVAKHVNLYFEPTVSKYLTESDVRTVYTDSPVTFTLQFGVRFTY